MMDYLPAITVIALLYGMLGLSLNLQWGHTGIINFGHVAFFAIGAYVSALLNVHRDLHPLLGLVLGFLVAALASLPIGWITLRLREDFLAIVTIGFSESLRIILSSSDWSGGPSGVVGIDRPFSTLPIDDFNVAWVILGASGVGIVLLLVAALTESPFGRLLRAVKSDERAVAMLGKNVPGAKTVSLVIGSGIAGAAGALYAHYIGYIAPDQFQPHVTFYVWAGIIIGGSSHLGALLGSIGLIGLFEASRFIGDFGFTLLSSTELANLRLVAVGVVILLFLKFRPHGLLPYRPRSRGGPGDSHVESFEVADEPTTLRAGGR